MRNLLKLWKLQNLFIRSYAKKLNVGEMKYLNVAEKNDAAKTIAGLLSRGTSNRREGYSVYNKIYEFDANVKGSNSKMVMTSVSGHLLQLEFLASYRNWRNVSPLSLFTAPVQKSCPENFQPIKRTLEREIRGCQGLIIWTDCDREGENIGLEIVEVCRAIKPGIKVFRAIFSEITRQGVQRALQNLSVPDQRQSDAVDIRTELDLRTGAAITRLQTMRLQRLFPEKIADKLISYGSCQIPTLGFVVERYKEIEAFVSEQFWKIKVLHTIEDLTVEFHWARNRLFDKAACEAYLNLCLADPKAKVENVTVKPKSKWRPQPMDTVELEKLGSRKLKLSAKEVMVTAEKLYTKGFISYPRTETNQFSKEINLTSLVEQQTEHDVWGSFAQRVMEWGPNPRNGNKSDKAHPPIHPTKMVTNLQGNEARVYELICRHFLACVSKDAVGSETICYIDIAGEKFSANGLCIYERNYLDVYVYDKWNAKQIHKYEIGQIFDPTEISLHEGATTPPPLLTEADLIALMEKHGIGTDATHAEHINTIKERGYIGVVDKGFLVPGIIGMGLCESYDAMELAFSKPMLRAEFEADLKKICLGEKDPQIVLQEQIERYKEAYKQFIEKINNMDTKISQRINETPSASANNDGNSTTENDFQLKELFKCPKCNRSSLVLRQKKNGSGHFITCMGFPDCKHTVTLPDECKEAQVLDENCQKCGSSVKLLKFKFINTYYKTLFTAPYGWYKTCLRCDSHFRDTFGINLDSVKNTGAIVSDSINSAPRSVSQRNPILMSNATNGTTQRNGSQRGGATSTTHNSGPGNMRKPRTQKLDNLKKTEVTGTRTVRSFLTSAQNSSVPSSHHSTSEQRETLVNEMFDSNDSFDVAILDIEGDVAQRSEGDNNNILSDELAAVFDDNNDFEESSWGTGTRGNTGSANARSANEGSTNARSSDYRRSGHSANSNSQSNYSQSSGSRGWGTAASIQQNGNDDNWGNNANDSLSAYLENNNGPDEYVWGTNASMIANRQNTSNNISFPQLSESPVKCTGCHQLAKQCTVRKEGPNTGRIFYSCSKMPPCKFFQWAGEESRVQMPSTSSGTTSGISGTTSGISGTTSGTSGINNNAGNEEVVNCNCGTPAKSFTVRKEGPNKGRQFHTCPNRDSSCGFFKWSDESNDAEQSENLDNMSWGTGRKWSQNNTTSNSNTASTSSSSWGTGSRNTQSANTQENRKRKCGLCRQEGHNKTKCPRKEEFQC